MDESERSPTSSNDNGKEQQQENAQEGFFHTVVTGLGILLVVACIGILLHDALMRKEGPPEVVLHVEKIQPQPSGNFVVLFRAENHGDSTAADLFVTGELQGAAGLMETSRATLDYVPAQSVRRGGLFFDYDPRKAQLELRATGYQEP